MTILEVRAQGCENWQAVFHRVPILSSRELDVFGMLAKGLSNRVIATRLAVTERTVKAHVASILAKLGVGSRLEAGLVAFAWAVVTENAGLAKNDSLVLPPAPRRVRRSGEALVSDASYERDHGMLGDADPR